MPSGRNADNTNAFLIVTGQGGYHYTVKYDDVGDDIWHHWESNCSGVGPGSAEVSLSGTNVVVSFKDFGATSHGTSGKNGVLHSPCYKSLTVSVYILYVE